MPPLREYDNAPLEPSLLHPGLATNDDDDDDDMPPLVDDPVGGMTFTFLTDTSVPAATHHHHQYQHQQVVRLQPPSPPPTGGASQPHLGMIPSSSSSRPSHGKKRDASYIPRPPNAFILFRSSFIRSQQVTGKVEGNHSTLSKIIGLYWKTLPREEREKWEEKAVIAQEEHRQRYPDWRFRPAANAIAKLRNKDGASSSSRKRTQSKTKDPPDDDLVETDSLIPSSGSGSGVKGKGKAKAKSKETVKEKRCAKIADFLVEGKKGEELEKAVKEWEGAGRKNAREKRRAQQEQGPPPSADALNSSSSSSRLASHPTTPSFPCVPNSSKYEQSRDQEPPISPITPDSSPATTNLSRIPLTHMFRRSLSAPTSRSRSELQSESADVEGGIAAADNDRQQPHAIPSHGHHHHHTRRDTVSFPLPPNLGLGSPHHQIAWQHDAHFDDRGVYSPVVSSGYWWGPSNPEAGFHPIQEREGLPLNTAGMGYHDDEEAHFSHPFLEPFQRATVQSPHDGSHTINWSQDSSRQGLMTVIQDSFAEQNKITLNPAGEPTTMVVVSNVSTPPSLVISPPSLSPTMDHHAPTTSSPPSPSTSSSYPSPPTQLQLPSSNFSTLSGWAGDYSSLPSTSGMVAVPSQSPQPVFSAVEACGNGSAESSGWHQPDESSAASVWDNRLQPVSIHHPSQPSIHIPSHHGNPLLASRPITRRSKRKVTFDDESSRATYRSRQARRHPFAQNGPMAEDATPHSRRFGEMANAGGRSVYDVGHEEDSYELDGDDRGEGSGLVHDLSRTPPPLSSPPSIHAADGNRT